MNHLVLSLVLLTLIASVGRAQTAPELSTIKEVTVGGSGCSPQSYLAGEPLADTRMAFVPDNSGFSFFPDNAVIHSEMSQPVDHKDCIIEVTLNVPAGWRYSIDQVDTRVNFTMDHGSFGYFNSEVDTMNRKGKWQRASHVRKIRGSFRKDVIEDVVVTQNVKLPAISRRLCQSQRTEKFRIHSDVKVYTVPLDNFIYRLFPKLRNPTSQGNMDLSSIDNVLKGTKVNVKWVPCQ